jgi:hypothetical protein
LDDQGLSLPLGSLLLIVVEIDNDNGLFLYDERSSPLCASKGIRVTHWRARPAVNDGRMLQRVRVLYLV